MAGSYPDAPGYKFAYDVDGTAVVWYGSAPVSPNSSQLRALNDDSPVLAYVTPGSSPQILAFIFPELRDVTGVLLNRDNNVGGPDTILEQSADTTNGFDGTWSTVISPFNGLATSTKPDLRTSITGVSLTGVKGIRFQGGIGGWSRERIRNIHLYGSTSPTASPNRLRVVDMTNTSTTSDGVTATGEDMAAQLDFGNIAQRANSTKQFKVVNNSSTQTATNITVSLDAPADASPSLIGQLQVSTDNIAYANAVNIGNLAPGASSGTLYLKNTIANNAQLSVWSARIIAHAVSWS